MNKIKAFLYSSVVPFMFYIGGYNFDGRGGIAVLMLAIWILFYLVALIPDIGPEDKLTREQLMNEIKANHIDDILREFKNKENKCLERDIQSFMGRSAYELRRRNT